MKKLLNLTKGDHVSSKTDSSNFIGKVFNVGKHTVTVEDNIAEGGFAIVFLAKSSSGQHFALKRMYVNNDYDLHVCRREIKIVKELGSHPHIVGYVDSAINTVGGGVYEILLLMEYHAGHALQLMNERLHTGFTESEILRLFSGICEAVSRLHHCQTPIVHRDLKVENILLDINGSPVLCDFGSATPRVLNPSQQGTGPVEEEIQKYTTLSYRAPEMIDLYSGRIIHTKADIWALGVMLYKLCYFSLPFGESTLAIQSAQFNIPETPPYSKHIQALIRYMLTADQDERPDIYQVTALVFSLMGRPCPIPNLKHSIVPSWEVLIGRLKFDSAKDTERTSRSTSMGPAEPSGTSVAPRSRPKAGQTNAAASLVPQAGNVATSRIQTQGASVLPAPPPSPKIPSPKTVKTTVVVPDPPSPPVPFSGPPSTAIPETTISRPPPAFQDLEIPPSIKDTPSILSHEASGAASQFLNSSYPLSLPGGNQHAASATSLSYGGGAPGAGAQAAKESRSAGDVHQHRRNVSDTSAFNKAFASETTLFLAPFESSKSSATSPMSGGGEGTVAPGDNFNMTEFKISPGMSVSQGALHPHPPSMLAEQGHASSAWPLTGTNGAAPSSNGADVSVVMAPPPAMPSESFSDWNPFREMIMGDATTSASTGVVDDRVFADEMDRIRRGKIEVKATAVTSTHSMTEGFTDLEIPAEGTLHHHSAPSSTTAIGQPQDDEDPFGAAPFTASARIPPSSSGDAPSRLPRLRVPVQDRSKYQTFSNERDEEEDDRVIRRARSRDSDEDSIGSASDLGGGRTAEERNLEMNKVAVEKEDLFVGPEHIDRPLLAYDELEGGGSDAEKAEEDVFGKAPFRVPHSEPGCPRTKSPVGEATIPSFSTTSYASMTAYAADPFASAPFNSGHHLPESESLSQRTDSASLVKSSDNAAKAGGPSGHFQRKKTHSRLDRNRPIV
ncbi:unnamed protein product [Cyprideis torosa]|uniref:Uncharacterized protein n=1 Tax=Cyprideis torosa TaxID=163714 RepID=A0A7R8ZLZ5_9CRUS|nr:unnamed protein product [Cyprideis torosa]CAG0887784.1 unnamed protein product [Cyprideis torosa]